MLSVIQASPQSLICRDEAVTDASVGAWTACAVSSGGPRSVPGAVADMAALTSELTGTRNLV